MIEAKEHETCGSLAHARHRGRFNADPDIAFELCTRALSLDGSFAAQ